MRSHVSIGLDDARRVVDQALAEAAQRGVGVAVAVVDDAGILVALGRSDEARLHTPEVAWRKARTAAILRTETAKLQAQIAGDPALITFPDRLPVAGGIPILHEGAVVGAVGCSGGLPDEDVAICEAGIGVLS